MPYEILTLTEEQQAIALANYATLDHQELTRLVYKNDTLDGRSTEGKSIKALIYEKKRFRIKPILMCAKQTGRSRANHFC